MPDQTHPETVDWNRYWTEADAEARASATPSAHHMRDLLADFFEAKGVPDSFASVGCGPGVVAFDVAERHTDTTVVGYDAAESILAENRERAREETVENAEFERAVLPEFAPDRQFDVVFCYGTLCYVAESAVALRNLYGAVAPGGYLVLGYVNDQGRAAYQGWLDAPDDHPDESFDPERFEERFRLVVEGESTLSYRSIHDALGTWPRSFREFTDRPDERWAWDHVPSVWVPK